MKSGKCTTNWFQSLLAALLLLSLFLGDLTYVHAATILVNTLADEADGSCADGDCSLRDAVSLAASGETIQFSVTGTIVLTQGQIIVRKSLSLLGPGPDALTVSSNNASRIFQVEGEDGGGNIVISGITIANGKSLSYQQGGAIANYHNVSASSHHLTLNNCRLENNSTQNSGGAIYSTDPLTITGCTFSNNSAQSGGAIYAFVVAPDVENSVFIQNTAAGDGGAISIGGRVASATHLHITNTRFTGNLAGEGGGAVYTDNETLLTVEKCIFKNNRAADGGAISHDFTTVISGSSLYENTADFTLAGGDGYGGGIYSAGYDTSITIKNTSIYNNTAKYGGGMRAQYNPKSITVLNSTFANNSPENIYGAWGSNATLHNSILSNIAGVKNYSVSYAGLGVDSSHNLVTDSSGAISSGFTQVTPAALG